MTVGRRLAAMDWLVVAALGLGFFWNLGGAPLFDRDEGAFSVATAGMFERDDFISVYNNGKPRYEKPIFIHWCQAVPVAVFGPQEFAFRLPSAVAASLWVVFLYRFLRQRRDRQTARVAAVLMATAVGIMSIGRAAIADGVLNVLVTLAMLDIFRWSEAPRRGLQLRIFLWLALGMLTKGPIALGVPGLVSLLYFLVRGRWRDWFRLWVCWPGIALFLVVAVPWHVAQYLKEGQAWIDGFFLEHNVGRFAGAMEGHGGDVWYYLPVLLIAFLPHTALLLRILPRVRQWRQDSLDLYCWLWFAFVFVFFTVSDTKLPHYVYIGIAPLFMLMGRYREDLSSRWLALLPGVLLMTVLVAMPAIVPVVLANLEDPNFGPLLAEAPPLLGAGYVVPVAAGLVVMLVVGWRVGRPVWRALAVAGLVQAAVVTQIVVPVVGAIQQGPVVEAARRSRELDVPVVMWRLDNPSIGVYRGRSTPDRPPVPGEAVIMRHRDLPRLEHPSEILWQRAGIVLARLAPPETAPPTPPAATP